MLCFDHAEGLQAPRRFPEGDTADAELCREVRFARESRTGGQIVLADVVAQSALRDEVDRHTSR